MTQDTEIYTHTNIHTKIHMQILESCILCGMPTIGIQYSARSARLSVRLS